MKIRIRAHPGAKQDKFIQRGEVLHTYLTEPAKDGRANKQLLELMKKKYGPCRIMRGLKSRDKIIETI